MSSVLAEGSCYRQVQCTHFVKPIFRKSERKLWYRVDVLFTSLCLLYVIVRVIRLGRFCFSNVSPSHLAPSLLCIPLVFLTFFSKRFHFLLISPVRVASFHIGPLSSLFVYTKRCEWVGRLVLYWGSPESDHPSRGRLLSLKALWNFLSLFSQIFGLVKKK
jgi:hypothetical protein